MPKYTVRVWIQWEDGYVWDTAYSGRHLLPAIYQVLRGTRRGDIVKLERRGRHE